MKTLNIGGEKFTQKGQLFTRVIKNNRQIILAELDVNNTLPGSNGTVPAHVNHHSVVDNSPGNAIAVQINKADLKFVALAAATSDIRYYLNTVAISPSGKTVVATDGHRLHTVGYSTTLEADNLLLIPVDVVKLLIRVMLPKTDGFTLIIKENKKDAQILAGNITITFELMDGKYPDIHRVIPTESSKHVKLTNLDATALKNMLPFANQQYFGILFNLANSSIDVANLSSSNTYANQFTTSRKAGIEIGLNLKYMVSALSITKESKETTIQVTDANSSVLLTEPTGQKLAVVMSIRL